MRQKCVYWKDNGTAIEFDNYEIDSNGKVYNISRNTLMKECINTSTGRPFYSLRNKGRYYTCLTHRLVYSTFVGTIPQRCDVIHLDGDYTNNNINNLALEQKIDFEELDNYIINNADRYSTRKFDMDVAELFNINPNTVYNHRKKLGIGWLRTDSCKFYQDEDRYFKENRECCPNRVFTDYNSNKFELIEIALHATRFNTNPKEVAEAMNVSYGYTKNIFRQVHNIMFYVYVFFNGSFNARQLYVTFGFEPDILDTIEKVLSRYGGISPAMIKLEDLEDPNKSFGNEMFSKNYK